MTTSLSAHLSQRHGRGLAHLWTLYSTFKNVNKCCELNSRDNLCLKRWTKMRTTNRNWPSKDFKWAIFCCWQCKSKWEMRTNIYGALLMKYIFHAILQCCTMRSVFVVRELKADFPLRDFFARSDFFFCLTISWLERIKIYSNFTIEYHFARQKSRSGNPA